MLRSPWALFLLLVYILILMAPPIFAEVIKSFNTIIIHVKMSFPFSFLFVSIKLTDFIKVKRLVSNETGCLYLSFVLIPKNTASSTKRNTQTKRNFAVYFRMQCYWSALSVFAVMTTMCMMNVVMATIFGGLVAIVVAELKWHRYFV